MERTEVLDMMSSLKLYGMRSAYDETLATALKRKHEPQRFVGDLLKAEILREAGALDQVPAHRRQAAAGQGRRRLRVQEHADQRGSRTRPRRRRLHRPAPQCRPGRGNRHRQDASGHRHRAKLHPSRIARALLHHRRSRQSARGSSARWPPRTARRLSHAPRLRHPRRTRLSPLRPGRRAVAVPSHQPSL